MRVAWQRLHGTFRKQARQIMTPHSATQKGKNWKTAWGKRLTLQSIYIYIHITFTFTFTFTSKKQKFHPVPPKIMKIKVICMKFQGASIGKGPGGPKSVKDRFF